MSGVRSGGPVLWLSLSRWLPFEKAYYSLKYEACALLSLLHRVFQGKSTVCCGFFSLNSFVACDVVPVVLLVARTGLAFLGGCHEFTRLT